MWSKGTKQATGGGGGGVDAGAGAGSSNNDNTRVNNFFDRLVQGKLLGTRGGGSSSNGEGLGQQKICNEDDKGSSGHNEGDGDDKMIGQLVGGGGSGHKEKTMTGVHRNRSMAISALTLPPSLAFQLSSGGDDEDDDDAAGTKHTDTSRNKGCPPTESNTQAASIIKGRAPSFPTRTGTTAAPRIAFLDNNNITVEEDPLGKKKKSRPTATTRGGVGGATASAASTETTEGAVSTTTAQSLGTGIVQALKKMRSGMDAADEDVAAKNCSNHQVDLFSRAVKTRKTGSLKKRTSVAEMMAMAADVKKSIKANAAGGDSLGRRAKRKQRMTFVQKDALEREQIDSLKASAASTATGGVPALPPDQTLLSMERILAKRFKNVSVQDWYNTCWAESASAGATAKDTADGQDTISPFYQEWLVKSGKMDIKVGKWERKTNDDVGTAAPSAYDDEGGKMKDAALINEYDKERYDQQRLVSFRFQRTTHLYTGPPIAEVTHTHYCRMISATGSTSDSEPSSSNTDETMKDDAISNTIENVTAARRRNNKEKKIDRCIVAMKIEMQGIPFADNFHVQVRWVATRVGDQDLSIQVGLFVVFTKSVFVEGKIKAGTTEQTTESQRDLLMAMQKRLGCDADDVEEGGSENDDGGEKKIRRGLSRQGHSSTRSLGSLSTLDQTNNAGSFFATVAKMVSSLTTASSDRFEEGDSGDDIDKEMRRINEKMNTIKRLQMLDSIVEQQIDYATFLEKQFAVIKLSLRAILIQKMGYNWKDSVKPSIHATQNKIDRREKRRRRRKNRRRQFEIGFREYFDLPPLPPSKSNAGSAAFYAVDTETTLSSAGTRAGKLKDELCECIPTDRVLESMTVVVNKTITGASVTDFYNACIVGSPFSSKSKTRSHHHVGGWVLPEQVDEPFFDEWSNESYDQMRLITFRFHRSASILSRLGPSSAKVRQLQYYRLGDTNQNKNINNSGETTAGAKQRDQNACVLMTINETIGAPFSSCYRVFTRLVVTPITEHKLSVKAGYFVCFLQTTPLDDRIREAIDKETSRALIGFFWEASAALRGRRSSMPVADSCRSSERLIKADADVERDFNEIGRRSLAVDALVGEKPRGDNAETFSFVLAELMIANEYLDKILVWYNGKLQQQNHNKAKNSSILSLYKYCLLGALFLVVQLLLLVVSMQSEPFGCQLMF